MDDICILKKTQKDRIFPTHVRNIEKISYAISWHTTQMYVVIDKIALGVAMIRFWPLAFCKKNVRIVLCIKLGKNGSNNSRDIEFQLKVGGETLIVQILHRIL